MALLEPETQVRRSTQHSRRDREFIKMSPTGAFCRPWIPDTHTRRFTVCSRVASVIADAFVETARAHINKAKISRKQSTKSQVSSGRGMGATNVLRPTHSHSKWLLESAWLWRMLHLQWKCINPGATASTRVHRFAHYLPSNSSNAALCCGSGAIALHESSEIRRSFVVLVARRFALIQN